MLQLKKYQMLKPLIIFLSVSNIVACSWTHLPTEVHHSINEVNKDINHANKNLEMAQNKSSSNFITTLNDGYIGGDVIIQDNNQNLPAKFNDPIELDGYFTSMQQIANSINKLTKYAVLLDTPTLSAIDIHVMQAQGSLIDLLNNIAAKTNTAWSYRDGKILISDSQTKTWQVHIIPGDIQIQNQINSNNGIQGSAGGNSASTGSSSGGQATSSSQSTNNQTSLQNVKFNLVNSFWDDLSNTIKSILSKQGKFAIMPATSTLTVTDNPYIITKVDDYIKQQNAMLRRQVQIDVQVLSVETNASDDYGINWGLALHGADASFSINGQPTSGNSGTTSGKSLSPVFIPNNTTQAFTIGANKGDLSGSQLVINALSRVGKTTMVVNSGVTTNNYQPVPVQMVEQQGYVASTSTTQAALGGSQQSVTTGQIDYGFVLNVLPVIEASGMVNLQISMNLSSLKALTNFGTAGSMVQLPDMLQRNTMQKTTLRSGDTYVITGFDSDYASSSKAGVGGASNWLFGGGVSASKTRSRLVLLITPRVVND